MSCASGFGSCNCFQSGSWNFRFQFRWPSGGGTGWDQCYATVGENAVLDSVLNYIPDFITDDPAQQNESTRNYGYTRPDAVRLARKIKATDRGDIYIHKSHYTDSDEPLPFFIQNAFPQPIAIFSRDPEGGIETFDNFVTVAPDTESIGDPLSTWNLNQWREKGHLAPRHAFLQEHRDPNTPDLDVVFFPYTAAHRWASVSDEAGKRSQGDIITPPGTVVTIYGTVRTAS